MFSNGKATGQVITRRHMLAGSAAVILLGVTPLRAKTHTPLYASSRRDKDGQNFAVIFSPDKGDVASVKLTERAHHISSHPLKTECVAVARRPGRSSVVFGPDRKPHWFYTREDRHFQGHGVFSLDGHLFYTTENDYEDERGVIGVRDVESGFKQIGEFPSYGIGPHQLEMTDNGKTLIIANGGILTHPDMGREKLNLRVMEPSLVYMDAKTGELLEKRILSKPLHQVSIRHFAVSRDGSVAFGGQHNGSKTEHPPLMGFHRRGEEIEIVKAPIGVQKAMRNYMGSVAINIDGTVAAATCPRGNLVTFWNMKTRRYLTHVKLDDGCGVAPTGKSSSFLLTSGHGKVGVFDVRDGGLELAANESLFGYQWDNHLSRLR